MIVRTPRFPHELLDSRASIANLASRGHIKHSVFPAPDSPDITKA